MQPFRFLVASALLVLIAGTARADNPYGVMLWPRPGEDTALLLARARGLGVAWYRPPTVYLGRWTGAETCAACRAFAGSGLRLAITVRTGGEEGGTRPSGRPPDLDAYRRRIDEVLAAWAPSLIVVENEEDDPASYSAPGDAVASYGEELAAACAAAHARKIACANGGISQARAVAATWLGFLADGQADRACDFAQRMLADHPGLCAYRTLDQLPAAERAALAGRAPDLLALYRKLPIDGVNFHWFGTDAQAFAEVASYLGRTTGKPVITNEMGQRRDAVDPNSVRPLLRAALAATRVAIWFSVDTATTVSLFDPDGRLRPSGWEFQRQTSGLR